MLTEIVYAGALFAAGVVSAVTAIVVLGRVRSYTQRVPLMFAATALSAAVWATAYGFSLLSTTPAGRALWLQVLWFGAASLATFWFAFALSYTRYEGLLTSWTATLLAVEPLVVIGIVVTAGRHDFLLAGSEATAFGVLPTVSTAAGPLLLFHGVYTGVLVLAGLGCLVVQYRRSRRLYRRQVSVVLAASVVPVVASLLSADAPGSAAGLDVTPVAFGLSSVAILVGFYRYQLFDLSPIARDVVVGELRDGAVVVDDRGRVVETNPRARQIFDTEEDSLLGRRLADVPDYGPTLQRIVDDPMAREEFVVDASDGDRFFEATASRFDGQGAHERGHLIMLRDVTERRRTEEEFRALIENSRDLITVVAPDGTRVYCAPSFERTLGHDPEEMIGREAFELLHPDDRDEIRRLFERLLADEQGTQERAEYRVRHADGSWRTFEAVGVNLVDDPTVQGVVVNARDVTARRRYEQRLRVLNRVLRHDLRNEVNVIQGHADLLLERNVTAEAKEHARVIRKKAETLVELGEQTRKIDYTLHSTDGVEKPLEITESIRDRLDSIQEEFPGAIVVADLPDEQWVLADDLIDSAMMNLIDNAIEHNDRVAPQISVTIDPVTDDGVDYVEVAVADNGPGIPESERRVFTEGTETPLSHGSGLGLWLVEWIVTRSNGHLYFEENEPRGTVVRIRLRETTPMSTEGPESQAASTD
ncbi:PAS domain-containing sensor histidine kinase [Salinigranum rubrum]|uniref:PAS domain-containing sensor histidine kinase n=1 Tax=Salinigranum rubrum TaxID=755307 RepID=A0A2I8VI07_9EURY|nr:histidine kinase N-terminal 7TM domain-containing protein [Salinigranum rubrum]AUV81545.1 PAS domain-containing sensor histidine kinase [Salinigranum rubrum]